MTQINEYRSPWFTAVYLLLSISLIGCVVPRLRVYLKAVRARPPKPPLNLNRALHRTPPPPGLGPRVPDPVAVSAGALGPQP